MKEFTRTVDRYSYAGFEYGKKEQTSLVCLHGMTEDSHSFIKLANMLEDHFHLIVLDNPGHGHSSSFRMEEEYLFSSIVWQIDKVLNTLVEGPFYLLGHAWGADIALHFAKHYPEKVKGIILIDGGYIFPEQIEGMTKEKALADWAAFLAGSKYDSWKEITDVYKHYTTAAWNESMNVLIRSNFKQVNLKYKLKVTPFTVQAAVKAFFKEPCSSTYDYIYCPVLLFHATVPMVDPSRERGIENISRQLKQVQLVGIPGTKHNIHWDKPGHMGKMILSWRQTIESQ